MAARTATYLDHNASAPLLPEARETIHVTPIPTRTHRFDPESGDRINDAVKLEDAPATPAEAAAQA